MNVRSATEVDLPSIVASWRTTIWAQTEKPPANVDPYRRALASMRAQTGNELLVAEVNGEVIGCLQLILLPGISRSGVTCALIESVRITRDRRGQRDAPSTLAARPDP